LLLLRFFNFALILYATYFLSIPEKSAHSRPAPASSYNPYRIAGPILAGLLGQSLPDCGANPYRIAGNRVTGTVI